METLIECPVCGSNEFQTILSCTDFLVSQKQFSIQKCRNCDFELTNPRPDAASIGAYYQSEQYISHSDTKQGLMSQLYHAVRNVTLKQKVKLIDSLKSDRGWLLDIGCGSGYFLAAAHENGWQIQGVEPNENARTATQKLTGAYVSESVEALPDSRSYDVITMWHVLEHVHELSKTMQWLNDHCRKNGYLIIAVPNHRSWDADRYKHLWAAYDVPRHLYHFSQDSMQRLLDAYGFRLIGQKPMLFDAFYVNLLSTRYRDGQPAYIESFLNGVRSNWSAYRNGGDYSSLIYIATHK